MKFTVLTQEFNYLIAKCLNVVSPKPTMPVLSNILIEAQGGVIKATATDLTVSIRCQLEATVLEKGATTLPARRLAQLARELTGASTLEITTNANESTEIIANSSRFRLLGMSKADFPSMPDLEESMRFTLPQPVLRDVLFRTAFAVSREDTRFVLSGVALTIANSRATFAGTDGKRLSRSFLPIPVDPSFCGSYALPIKAVEEAEKALKDDGEVSVYLMADKIAFETEDTLIIAKLLSGDYPNIDKVIPEATEIVVDLHREELMSLLRQVSLFTGEGSHAAKFSFCDGELKLDANSMEVGEGKVSMPANYDGPQLDIAFNPTYFLDILRHTKGETVTLGMTDPHNPGIITDKESYTQRCGDMSPLFLIMPMMIKDQIS